MGRTPEQLLWDALKRASIKSRFDYHRIENSAGTGFPDVAGINHNGVVFLIEGKALKEWPKRATTLPLKNSFEPRQLSFARRWNLLNGHAYIVLKVAKTEYYLLRESMSEKTLTECTTEELKNRALVGLPEILKYLEELQN